MKLNLSFNKKKISSLKKKHKKAKPRNKDQEQ